MCNAVLNTGKSVAHVSPSPLIRKSTMPQICLDFFYRVPVFFGLYSYFRGVYYAAFAISLYPMHTA